MRAPFSLGLVGIDSLDRVRVLLRRLSFGILVVTAVDTLRALGLAAFGAGAARGGSGGGVRVARGHVHVGGRVILSAWRCGKRVGKMGSGQN